MIFNKKLAVAVSGATLLMAGQIALADSTTDIVDALVSKGVLTEEEGKLISKGAKSKSEADAKANKARVSVGSFIDNAKLYGDVRARYERRDQDNVNTGLNQEVNRSRYKFTLGAETTAGNWYSDIAFAASSNGRSDNVTFGDGGLGTSTAGGDWGMSAKDKGAVYVKRAMIGWNPTPWLAVEAGRMKNPLYSVNAMVFDYDIVMEGAQEKLKYTMGNTDLFANLGQWVYTGGGVSATNDIVTSNQNLILAFQAGLRQNIVDGKVSAKMAISDYNYTTGVKGGKAFRPSVGNAAPTATWWTDAQNVNDLNIIDIPAEVNYMVSSNIGIKGYGEYAWNTMADRRRAAAEGPGGITAGFDQDDSAWLLGLTVGSAKDLKAFEGKKLAEGDWNINGWYQSVGTYALDPNSVDSDIFDGKINMKGYSLKAQYNIQDNVAFNFTGSWGKRKNSQYGTTYTKADLGINGDDFELYQFDVTYKF
jgi:polyhydroxyalkanoate synthesis regulator phasin